MFRVAFLVDDKHLASLLHALTNFKIHDLETNPAAIDGAIGKKNNNAPKGAAVVALAKMPATFKTPDYTAAYHAAGGSGMASNPLNRLRQKKLIKHAGLGTWRKL
jgi:hypothetical protein